MERELKIAYIAGVLDSDGFFTIHRNIKQSANPTYSPDMGINQVEPQAIDLAYELFGGKIGKIDYSKQKARFSQKPMFTWKPHKAGLLLVLEELIPHLRIKKAKAEILYRLRQDIVFHGRTGGREKKILSPQTVQFRDKLYVQFQALKLVAETECEDLAQAKKRQSELLSNEQSFTEMLKHLNGRANAI